VNGALEAAFQDWVDSGWDRRRTEVRLLQLIARYDTALREASAPMVVRFPTGLREARALPPTLLRVRRVRAEQELRRLRAGAPLPPDDEPAVAVVAVAELQWLLGELRAASSRRRRSTSVSGAVAGYLSSARPDRFPLTEAALAAWSAVPRRDRLSVAIELVEARLASSAPDLELRPYLFDVPEPDLGALSDFPDGAPASARFGPERLAVVRMGDHVRVVDGLCPHRGGSLCHGWVEDGAIVCPVHVWAFDLNDGRERAGRDRIRIWPARVVDGRVRLEGDFAS
jgi:nitrite reductase (NADH) small subunit